MPDMLVKAGALLFMVFFFGLCIFVHELGHFLVARWRKLHVIAFSIGFKKIWWRKIGGIEYRIGCIPFGGYVEIPQIDASGEAKDENGNTLPKAKPVDRILAVFAGPFSNLLFGLFLGVFVWIYGIPQDTPKLSSFKVAAVEESSPEHLAGLRKGDIVYKVNGESFYDTWNGIIRRILFNIGDVTLSVRRDGKDMSISYKPKVNRQIMPEEEIAYPFFSPQIPAILYPESGSPAEKAGIKPGDEAIKLNGREISGQDQFDNLIFYSDGRPMDLTVRRNGKTVEISGLKAEPIRQDAGAFMLGVSYAFSGSKLRVGEVYAGSPAESAGIKHGDEIISVDGMPLKALSDFGKLVASSEGKTLKLSILRDGAPMAIEATPKFIHFCSIGVQFAFINHPNPFEQFIDVLALSYKSLRGVFVTLGNRMGLTRQYSSLRPSHFSGPIGIGKYLYRSVYRGSFMQGLYIVIIISFNLALLNLLPIPVLDGGHIVLALFEMVFRKPLPPKLLQPVTIAFVTILISFMLFVSFYDIKKLLPYGREPAGGAKIIESKADIQKDKGESSKKEDASAAGAAQKDKKD